ncbi:MAG TPA: DUF2061 domain-containing protein [Methylophaga aminisulfidivorans]|uniref:DUF2061 domain-containing protein n=2 Tax=root TaxID=1 RepID=A0A7C1VNN5_9GAMM|nr:DUF2061 domain-containing protein [Methylophaga sp.]HEC72782.1 DUF2061 domain-containing protein [Methylophaga aminisulfidivorans]
MIKTLSFAAIHFSVAFSVGYIMTGSVLVGGTMALVEPAINTVAFYFHDKLWTTMDKNKSTDTTQLSHSHV